MLSPLAGETADSTQTTAIKLADLGTEGLHVKLGDQPGQTAVSAVLPDGRRALKVSWDGKKADHFALMLPEAPKIPDFGKGRIRVNIYLPDDGQLTVLSLRVRDKYRETFHIKMPVEPGPAGWRAVYYDLDATAPFTGQSWGLGATWSGGNGSDKIMDFPLTVFGLTGGFKSRTSEGWVGIGEIEFIPISGGADFAVRLETGNPIHVLVPGKETGLGLTIENVRFDGAARQASLKYTVRDVDNRVVTQKTLEQDVAQDGKGWFVPLPAPEKLGIHYIDIELASPGADTIKRRMSYSYMTPSGPTPGKAKGFLFGISSHPQHNPLADQKLEAMVASWAGAKIVREDIRWENMERLPGEWDFRDFDRTVSIFGEENIELQVIFDYLPAWATAKDWKPVRPERMRGYNSRPDFEHWRNFIRTFTKRYGDRLTYVEVWNEPDLYSYANFPAGDYVKMVKIASEEAKKINPNLVVLTGGYASLPHTGDPNVNSENMPQTLREARDAYDVVAIHAHGTFSAYRSHIGSFRQLLKDLGVENIPWYSNETAISSYRVGEKEQAITLFQKLIYSWANGAIGYTWYDLRNDGFDPKHIEHNFGMVTRDFYPKAIYPVYNMLTGTFTGATFLKAMRLALGREAYLFRHENGDYLLANWLNEPVTSNLVFLVDGVAGGAERIDLFGNIEKIPVSSEGLMVMEAGKLPSTYRMRGGDTPPTMRGQIAAMTTPLLIVPGEGTEAVYEFRNPTDKPLDFNLKMELPEGARVDSMEDAFTLAPRSSRTVRVGLSARADYAASSAAGHSANLKISIPGMWEGEIDSPIKAAFNLPQREFSDQPTFRLDDPAQVTSLAINDPNKAYLHWRDTDDLSARVWLAWADDALLLKVVVTDDKHFQPYSGAGVWQGDNVQFVLSSKGDLWELGLTHMAEGKTEVYCWAAPKGADAAKAAKAISLETARDEQAKTTTYLARIPLAAFGIADKGNTSELRFNLIVNDNDGEQRKGFIAVAPGLGIDRDSSEYPVIYSKPAESKP